MTVQDTIDIKSILDDWASVPERIYGLRGETLIEKLIRQHVEEKILNAIYEGNKERHLNNMLM